MSVIVKHMEMPETCEECAYQTKGACFASGVNKGTITIRRMDKERPDWCPLVELPEKHGDLIDREQLIKKKFKNDISYAAFVKLVERQLAVVKAEGEDGRA